jgi:methyl-accepting chemotaxis protein
VALVAGTATWGSDSGTVSNSTTSTGATADGANTTRQSTERVGVAAAEIEGLIGQFSY